jgi:hypothetical protein
VSEPRERVDAVGGVVEAPTGCMWPTTDPAALQWPGEPQSVRDLADKKLKGGKK